MDGNEVPWYVILNLPLSQIYQQKNYPQVEFLYYDASMNTDDFQFIKISLQDQKSPVSQTFNQLNRKNRNQIQIVAWNDEKPDNLHSGGFKAHSKGFIAVNHASNKGLYFGHSLPKFPEINSNGTIISMIPDNAKVYGQSMICMSMSANEIEKLAQDLIITKPSIYFSNVKKKFPYPMIYLLTQNPRTTKNDIKSKVSKIKVGQESFQVFTKSRYFFRSIIKDLIIPVLDCSILTKTWGRPLLQSECNINGKKQSIKNIEMLQYDEDIKWRKFKDHSKWLLCEEKEIVCFGDLNRMQSQKKRGGSYFCLENIHLWNAFKKGIKKIEQCLED